MFTSDMESKRKKGLNKVLDAIKLHGGTTILSTGITGDDARLAKAVVDAGVKLIEPNHPAVALARGFKGVTNMHDAEQIRHELPVIEMIKVTEGIRNVVGQDIFITVGIPGGFHELVPVEISDEVFISLSKAGADGLHIHKSSLKDLEEVVNKAHKYGLLVDAYIGHPDDLHTFGLPARTPEEVAKVAKDMESIGVDFIGLMTGMSYEGADAGEIHPVVKERLYALVESVKIPTLAEGGINLSNFKAFSDTGVNILVVGTAIDDAAKLAVQNVVRKFI
ncbi:Thiamine monophosphate synthase/TENI [Tissierella praeacuta DSM 18095]|uniref:Thiamine monophosphate synthase/TENI n=1 Tax=Tissierella praeacuta DSM 18095 TaxID=1123404 RepID=A0A1M4TMY8_9FIRM|nr:thiamine phosphate synthase [Tissierella praeacuta]SHE45808.1 Thiamine monophosphate synthase/TENI [Tissierella praeacuta DSM 18095]SUP04481.1 bifunctional hexulose-6-phosphate synthase/ribonuclease regulator [Tissierella praeacuta]